MQIKPDDKVEYKLVLTIRQMVNNKQNLVVYDSLLGIYSTAQKAEKEAKRLKNPLK